MSMNNYMSMFKKTSMSVILLVVLFTTNGFSQASINHNPPTVIERMSESVLEFEVLGLNIQDIQEVFFNYRYDDGIAYQSVRAEIVQNKVVVKISFSNELANSVQYYINFNMAGDKVFYYPLDVNATNKPISVVLVDPKEKKKEVEKEPEEISGSTKTMDFTILSPLPSEIIVPEDALVALTLFYNEGEASADSIKIIFDGVDVTSLADVTPYLITYKPKGLLPGNHKVSIEYSYNGEKIILSDWVFPTSDPNKVKKTPLAEGRTWAKGFAELSARNQSIFGITQDIYKASFRASGTEKWFRYAVNGMLTTQEDPRLQAQNRYGMEVYLGRWFELQAGHIFPQVNPLILAGNRIFGVNSSVRLFDRLVNFQVTYGEMRRSVDNLYQDVTLDSVVLGRDVNGIELKEPKYSLRFQEQGTGTFKREVLGGRFALGNGENFQWGFNSMKVRDDVNSLTTINDYDDLVLYKPELLNGLNAQQRAELDLAKDSLFLAPSGGAPPRDNFMFASDMVVRMFDKRITLRSDVGFSLLNNDISQGVLNQERADDLGITIDSKITNALDALSRIIIINENLSYLPVTIDTTGKIGPVSNTFLWMKGTAVPTGLMASQNSLNMRFFGNNFQARYQWVGPEYQTLSNTAMRRDIDGYSLTDRFRVYKNQIYVTLGFERFRDNLINQKESTTRTQILNSDFSIYPNDRRYPRVSLGYRVQNRDNGFDKFNPFLTNDLQYSAVRNLRIVSGDTVVVATPRQDLTRQITLSVSQEIVIKGIRNDLNINIMNINTDDKVYQYGSFKSEIYNIGVTTNWIGLPLKTSLNFTYNNSTGADDLSKVEIVGMNVGANYFFFDEKMTVFADLAFSNNSIKSTSLTPFDNGTTDNLLDDYYVPDLTTSNSTEQTSYIMRGGASYNFNKFHSLLFDASFTNVSVRTAGVNIPNDRVIQLRYVYRF